MDSNATKCNMMKLAGTLNTLSRSYSLGNNHIPKEADTTKYLGVMITDNRFWSTHLSQTCNKANATLSF